MIDPLYVASGFGVGTLVGLTGVGGGSLMTPLLILLFGIHPATAVGTDLLFAACTKTAGTVVHARNDTIEWPVTRRMMAGSIPAAALTILVLHASHANAEAASHVITPILAVACLATAVMLVFQNQVLAILASTSARIQPRALTGLTVVVGVLLGVLVTISSVGAGAMGVPALTLLYPRLPIARLVGTDIAHAIPLTLLAGLGYWMIGSIDWPLLGSLLSGSVPGIVVGSLLAPRIPKVALRLALAATLTVASVKLL